MPNYTVTNNIDALLKSTSNAAARTNLGLGDAATKNTGTTAGTVAAGDDSRITGALQTSGGTMTGKLTAAASDTEAKLNVGSRLTTGAPSTITAGDIWVSNQGALTYRDSSGPTSRALAATTLPNTFNQPQTIGSTANAGAVLSVSNSGTREVVTISNTATATSDAVVITNLGSGNSLVVNDETTPDSTRFAIANNGRVGIGVAPDAVAALAVDSTGIKFGDGTIQTTAGGAGGVSSFSAGTTGLTPATSTTGAVTLAGTLAIANGGTGQTTQQAALNALAGAVTSGQYLRGTGANVTLSAIQAADVPTLNQNTTGTASNVTGTVAIANGGTGQTTAANAINALVPTQSGQSGKVLTTNGSVVSWGTAGAGGITALTGDVSASGSGSVIASVTGLRGRVVATTAPTTGQVLGWNGTQWEPTSAGGSVAYEILKVLIVGPTTGIYTVPSGYKYADIYAAGGGGGGGCGAYTNSPSGGGISGGGGGASGVFGRREKMYVEGALMSYDIGAGGAGGFMDFSGVPSAGQAGQGTLINMAVSGVGITVLDCGFYINPQLYTGGQSGGFSPANGGYLGFVDPWIQDTQSGGSGVSGGVGQLPSNSIISSQTLYVSAGASGGGVDIAATLYDGGNILDRNYMLYSGGAAIEYKGTISSSSTIDATARPDLSPIFFGGAGGAAASSITSIYTGSNYRAGNGANGQPGCGGGGGGCMYDDVGMGPSSYVAGSGGNGGAGFLLMYLYK